VAAPNIWTVGTGKTYATISAAIAAAGTLVGDFVEVYATAAGSYPENVNLNKEGVRVVGMIPNQGVIINPAAGSIFTMGNNSTGLHNVTLTSAANTDRVTISAFFSVRVSSCVCIGGSYGIREANNVNYQGNKIDNCLIYGASVVGIEGTVNTGFVMLEHCTICKCTTAGTRNALGRFLARGMLCAGNGTDYLGSGVSSQNVSADLTAPGVGNVTGFNTADFVNYAGNDFRISQAARLTTLARLPGYPLVATDITGRRRPTRERVFFAGAYHGFEQPTWGVGELSGIA